MVKTASTMLPLGTRLPAFSLPSTTGETVSDQSLSGARGVLVMFICNHCPFVKHLRSALTEFGKECQELGVAVVGVSSNDVTGYPDDSPEKMRAEAEAAGYTFPYLYDADQSVAREFKAACTPDFYLFDGNRQLVYRGQFDASRPGNGKPVTGSDLRSAVQAMLAGKSPLVEQRPSIGCNIKWIPGQEPEYFTGEPASAE
ncbi:MAG: thioredoxin family protein [Planctomycetaceae bacterium]|nr:thioredoxin family protein [Planctomycetaceae bacterium]